MATITGRIEIRANGQLLLSKKGATLQWGGVMRVPVVEDDYQGFTEEVSEARVTVTVTDRDDVSISRLNDIIGGTINFDAIGGKQYILNDVTAKDDPTLTGGEGGVELEFFAPGPPTEILNRTFV